jgi:L-amino acid N-acyltransferase YncA
MTVRLTIRLATRDDAVAINAIYNYYVLHSTATFMLEPVTLEDRQEWLEDRPDVHPVTIAELDGRIAGWCALGPFRQRAAYGGTAEVGLYLDEAFHRRGIGRALIEDALVRARAAGLHVIVGGCCSETVASAGLLEACGFTRVAHFHEVGYKFGRWLDVIFFERILDGEARR